MKKLAMASSALMIMAGMVLAQGLDTMPWSMDEFMALYPDVTPELFIEIDTDEDGMISVEEYQAAVEALLIAPLDS